MAVCTFAFWQQRPNTMLLCFAAIAIYSHFKDDMFNFQALKDCKTYKVNMEAIDLSNIFWRWRKTFEPSLYLSSVDPASILYKSIAGRCWPVSYPDGPLYIYKECLLGIVAEPRSLKTYLRACALNEDSNQHMHPRSLISLPCPHEEPTHPWLSKMHPVKILILRSLIWIFAGRTCPTNFFWRYVSGVFYFVFRCELDTDCNHSNEKCCYDGCSNKCRKFILRPFQ